MKTPTLDQHSRNQQKRCQLSSLRGTKQSGLLCSPYYNEIASYLAMTATVALYHFAQKFIGKRLRYILALIIAISFLILVPAAEATTTWDRETVSMFSHLPVQDSGRVKPLDTYASFTLMQLNGRRTCKNPEDEKVRAIVWLIDCMFQPSVAEQYRIFRVENSEVLSAIGMQPRKKRDNYAYAELLPVREQLMTLGMQFSEKEERQRSAIEKETIGLAINLRTFETLTAYALISKKEFEISTVSTLTTLFPAQKTVRLSELLRKGPQVLAAYMELEHNTEENKAELAALTTFLNNLEVLTSDATTMALFPPSVNDESKTWLTPADLTMLAFSGNPMDSYLDLLDGLEKLADSVADQAAFKEQAKTFTGAIIEIAKSRGEYEKIPLEVTFYRLNLFYRALVFYILGFLVVACTWLRPQSRLLNRGAIAVVSLPTLLLLAGIALRCVIRGRPPVTTLYETILFVTLVAVGIALFLEWVNGKGLAISIGSVLGVLGMFLANKYEVSHGGDTMPAMVAVLDTNFWLALHVTTIAIGYGAGLFTAGMAHVFILGQLVGFRRKRPEFYTDLTRMVYGALCFSFVFVCIGTVLGGIWANESWGRFWGWDPKENGALMICLWQLAIIHARLDGMIKHHGINITAVIGGIIIAFSWFGVNMLGVGLHSYGFTSSGYTALLNFYIIEAIVAVLGVFVWFRWKIKATKGGVEG